MQYIRNLPHIQPIETVFFITTRLAGSLPIVVLELLQEEQELEQKQLEKLVKDEAMLNKGQTDQGKRYFARFDSLLDTPKNGPYWLSNPKIADIVSEALHYRAQEQYDLVCYTIMSNHIHFLVDTRGKGKPERPLFRILQSFKSFTAIKANAVLKRSGAFWHPESYDHVVRDGRELNKVVQYILQNPVKAGLAEHWTDWPYTYLNEAYL